MQRSLNFVVIALVLFSGMIGTGFGSGHDTQGKESGHSESHENKLYGIVQNMPAKFQGIWIVDGKEVRVTDRTSIKEKYGKAAVGVYVEVEGSYVDNAFTASKIIVKRGLR